MERPPQEQAIATENASSQGSVWKQILRKTTGVVVLLQALTADAAPPSAAYLGKPAAKADVLSQADQRTLEGAYGLLRMEWEKKHSGESFDLQKVNLDEHISLLMKIAADMGSEQRTLPERKAIADEAWRVISELQNRRTSVKQADKTGIASLAMRTLQEQRISGYLDDEEVLTRQVSFMADGLKHSHAADFDRQDFSRQAAELAQKYLETNTSASRRFVSMAKPTAVNGEQAALGRLDKAGIALQTLQRNPDDSQANVAWAMWLLSNGRFDDGFAALRKGNQKHPFLEFQLPSDAKGIDFWESANKILKNTTARATLEPLAVQQLATALERNKTDLSLTGISETQLKFATEFIEKSKVIASPVQNLTSTTGPRRPTGTNTLQAQDGMLFKKDGACLDTGIDLDNLPEFSISAVFKPNVIDQTQPTFMIRNVIVGNTHGAGGMKIGIDKDGFLRAYFSTEGGVVTIKSPQPISLDPAEPAHNFGITFVAPGSLNLYMDGQLVASAPVTGKLKTTRGGSVFIGGDKGNDNKPFCEFEGTIYAAKISKNSNPASLFDLKDPALLAAYQFSGEEGKATKELSGKGPDAKMVSKK